jgi:hypothetical protein
MTEVMLREVSQTLLLIYEVYFKNVAPTDLLDKSHKAVFEVLRDFDICPDVCNKVHVFKLMNSKSSQV